MSRACTSMMMSALTFLRASLDSSDRTCGQSWPRCKVVWGRRSHPGGITSLGVFECMASLGAQGGRERGCNSGLQLLQLLQQGCNVREGEAWAQLSLWLRAEGRQAAVILAGWLTGRLDGQMCKMADWLAGWLDGQMCIMAAWTDGWTHGCLDRPMDVYLSIHPSRTQDAWVLDRGRRA
eukprot:364857-Chlamydomonas_euryale.AAC.17